MQSIKGGACPSRLCICGVLQCVAVCCSASANVAACCSALQCVAVCCSVLQYPALRILQHTATYCNTLQHTAIHYHATHRAFRRNILLTNSLIQKLSQQITDRLTYWHKCCSEITAEWRRPTECLMLQVIFRKKATNYRGFVRKMTYKDRSLVRTCCGHDSGPFSREKLE